MRAPSLKLPVFVVTALCCLSPFSEAAAHCIGLHGITGQPVPVREIYLPNTPGPAWALSNNDMSGYPVITYYMQFYRLPRIMQRFSEIHECAHHNLGPNEIQANCSALTQMRENNLTDGEEMFIANFHRQLGPLPSQYCDGSYPCSGATFWDLTIACAGDR